MRSNVATVLPYIQVDLTEDHVSKIYCVPSDDLKTVFPTSLPRLLYTEVLSIYINNQLWSLSYRLRH